MNTECSICQKSDDLNCPACDKAFCISCFVDHGKACYEQSRKKQTEQGEHCSVCGRYASITPTVHCSDCQIEICRSCLWAHKKTHEEEKAKANWRYCVQCGLSKIISSLDVCSVCHGYVCIACKEAHQFAHTKSYHRCTGCGERTTTECDECHKPYCFPCFAKHRAVHEQKQEKTCVHCGADEFNDLHECHDCHKWVCEHHWHKHKADHLYTQQQAQTWHWCAGCNRAKQQDANKSGSPYWQCPTCHEYYCEACTMRHTHVYARANFAGRFNPDDFTVHGVHFKIDPDFIKESLKTAERVRQEQEAKQKKQEEEARRRKEEEFQREKARLNEEFFRRFFGGSYTSFSSSSTELQQAFSVLQLSTRATVQEVKHAFKRKAKEAHPDVGGSEEAFKKLNNAYEIALQYAKANER